MSRASLSIGHIAVRTLKRLAVAMLGAGVTVVALPSPASAHVDVEPSQVSGGDFAVVAFRVPNERDNASTTKVDVLLPRRQPLGSVQTTPVPGWKVTTKNRRLEQPIELFGSKVSNVVSEVTWTATTGGIRPGQFQDFELSLGQLPKSGKLVFNTVQTYSGGEQVAWNEVAVDESTEPEHPAPTLTLTAAEANEAGGEAAATATGSGGQAQSSQGTGEASRQQGTSALPVSLSVAALVLALAAAGMAGLAWRRTRA